MIVIGDSEIEEGTLAIRSRREPNLGKLTVDEFIEKIEYEVKNYIRC